MLQPDASAAGAPSVGPIDVLAARSPSITPAEAETLFRDTYAISATAVELDSERDQNFLMTAADGARMVLKLSNGLQDRRLTTFQTRALRHIAAVDPGLPVPRVIATRTGDQHFTWSDAEGGTRLGHVLSFMPGVPLGKQLLGPALATRAGTLAARLGRALRGFFDPAAGHELLWDFKHAARLADLLPFIECERDRILVGVAIERFCEHVAPRLPSLRGQVVHNDLNPHNLLVDPDCPDEPVGIIDFGDMVFGALVGDVAVATSYLLTAQANPFSFVRSFVGAYHAVTPLEEAEVALLPDLIATRHAMTCAITAWRAQRYPENAAYILRNVHAAVMGLAALEGSGREALAADLREACGRGRR